jgi:hypothetical protein
MVSDKTGIGMACVCHGGGMAGGAGSVYLGEDINGASPNRKVCTIMSNL